MEAPLSIRLDVIHSDYVRLLASDCETSVEFNDLLNDVLAKVTAAINDEDRIAANEAARIKGTWTRGDLSVNQVRHAVEWKGRVVAPLTYMEMELLTALAFHPDHVKTRNQLMDATYDSAVYVDDRTIDSHIKRLRKKMRRSDPDFTSIETMYGLGYRWRKDTI